MTLGLYDLSTFLNVPMHIFETLSFYGQVLIELSFSRGFLNSGVRVSALIPAVVARPELIWLKCINHHLNGNSG